MSSAAYYRRQLKEYKQYPSLYRDEIVETRELLRQAEVEESSIGGLADMVEEAREKKVFATRLIKLIGGAFAIGLISIFLGAANVLGLQAAFLAVGIPLCLVSGVASIPLGFWLDDHKPYSAYNRVNRKYTRKLLEG